MPSLFGRRRASSQPAQYRPPPPSSSAAIAASAAFMNSSPSTASLSSAAAAAALRSHTTSPEPIGSLQTKRMVRRGSQTSIGGGSIMGAQRPGAGRGGMVRQNSNSSMSERTFRSPSPGRAGALSPAPNAPPVPAIPGSLPKGQRRSSSMEPTMRVTSPTPKAGGRNASVDRAGVVASPKQSKKPDLPKMPELDREDSQRSVNFSRPMSPAPAPAPPRSSSSTGWFTSPAVGTTTPRTTAARPASSLGFSTNQDVQNAANKPVAKKKKKVAAAPEGAKLANGTMHAGPQGTAVTPTTTASPAKATPQPQAGAPVASSNITPVKKKKAKVVSPPADDPLPSQPPPRSPARLPSAADDLSPRAAGLLHKQPSLVREDPEAEASAEHNSIPTKKPLSKSMSLRDTGRTIATSEGPVRGYVAPGGAPQTRSVSLDIPRAVGKQRSSESLSPTRKVHAHFSEGSMLATPASIRHQPPPRSVSPAKSAMKHSPASSVRTSSPNVNVNSARYPSSDASDTNSLASQDGIKPPKKKKSARVSFEDGATTVSPVGNTATGRRDLSASFSGDESIEEIMKPRPALPLFGSVRGRKPEVRPEVRSEAPEKVTETVPSSKPTVPNTLPDHPEVSNDNAIAAVIANHHAQKALQTEGPKSESSTADALPPHVTSVEGSGQISDSSYSEDEDGVEKSVQSATQHEELPISEKVVSEEPASSVLEPASSEPMLRDLIVPDISVQPATPGVEEGVESPLTAAAGKGASVPRGWHDAEESPTNVPHANTEHETDSMGTETESSDDETTLQAAPAMTERHSPLLQPIYESDSDDDTTAFSDAAEELDEGGFASLDAIVESPARRGPRGIAIATPPDSPTTQLPASSQSAAPPSPTSSEPIVAGSGDWGQATAYWSSLSRTKKQELEREAREAEEAALVLESAPKSKKKSMPEQVDVTDPSFYAPPPPLESPTIERAQDEESDSRPPMMRKSMREPAEPKPSANETHMRKSMRGSAEPTPSANETHMRKSMRGPAEPASSVSETHMRKSMRGPVEPTSSSNETHMRKSMRGPVESAPPSNDTHMRKSMRSGGGGSGSMKTSMRGGDVGPQGNTPKKAGPSAGNLTGTSVSPAAVAAASLQAQPAKRSSKPYIAPLPPPNDSDSESSFKKKRRGSVSTVDSMGTYTMKRSMRSGSVDASQPRRAPSPNRAPPGSSRLSLRSLSPTGSFMGRNRGENIRASLRGAPVDDTPTMRGKNSKAARDPKGSTSFGMSGFSKPPKQAAAPAPARQPKSRFSSRFAADSDDEEDDVPAYGGFRSRFVDSDDEDSTTGPPKRAPADLAPVRGIPRRRDQEDDSTDLEDSDEEIQGRKKTQGRVTKSKQKPGVPSQSDIDAAMEAARRNVAAMNGGREPGVPESRATAQDINQPNPPDAPATPTRRRGFMGSILTRRRSSSVAPYSPQNNPTSPSAGRPPKLQRRTTPQNWPLPPPIPVENGNANGNGAGRPNTSDGTGEVHMRKSMRRPDLGRSLSGNDLKDIGGSYSEKTGRKKRFTRLRKVFGLHD